MTLDFDMIVNEYQDKVYNTCLGFLKNEADAEDTAQEVFFRIYKSQGTFRGDASLSTWIYRITVNKCLEGIRKRKKHNRDENYETLADQLPTTDAFYHPGVALENKERGAVLFAAMESLPEAQKIAFTLAKVEGLSYEEIAAIMEKTVSSVESLLHRARLNLRTELKTYYQHEKD